MSATRCDGSHWLAFCWQERYQRLQALQEDPTVQAVVDEMLALEEAMAICGNGLPKFSSNEVIAEHVNADQVGPEFDIVVKEALLEGTGDVADSNTGDAKVHPALPSCLM